MAGTLLAIDPGLKCGWAVHDGKQVVASGVWDLSGDRFEGAGMRWVRLRGYLNEIRYAFGGVSHVAYEAVRAHKGTNAAHVYGGVIAVIQEFCEAEDVPYEGVPVGTVKKQATGKGNSNKKAMVEAAREHWPDIEIKDDNHADALWIAEVAAQKTQPT